MKPGINKKTLKLIGTMHLLVAALLLFFDAMFISMKHPRMFAILLVVAVLEAIFGAVALVRSTKL